MKIKYLDGALLKKIFIGAANNLEKNKDKVDALNVFPVPDGDTGTNMSLTFQTALKYIMNLEDEGVGNIAFAAANGSLMGARGNSGVILSQLLRGFANGLKGKDKANAKSLAKAFKQASDTAYKAVMKPTEGTILTVARECTNKAIQVSRNEEDIVLLFKQVVEHGNETLNRTPEMLPVLKQAGVVDSGGMGLMVILNGAFQALNTDGEIVIDNFMKKENVSTKVPKDVDTEKIPFSYCTEFIISGTDANYEKFRDEISELGDSLLVVGNGDIIKVHIHTNNPGIVLEKAVKLGELNDIKIDNMKYQHRNLVVKEDDIPVNENSEEVIDKDKLKDKDVKQEIKDYSFITVGIGEGIKDIFEELNVDYVIPGGQTMNPSTEDILNAVNKVKGKQIIILPNNGNIVLAANQAKKLSDRKIYVLPTKTVPEGISALLAFNYNMSLKENIKNMELAIEGVKTGEITYAVRDTEIDGIKIKKDDVIGIFDDKIRSKGNDVTKVSFQLLKSIVVEDDGLITIFYGDNIEKEKAEELLNMVEKEFDDCDVELVYGGQPLYYYIFSVE